MNAIEPNEEKIPVALEKGATERPFVLGVGLEPVLARVIQEALVDDIALSLADAAAPLRDIFARHDLGLVLWNGALGFSELPSLLSLCKPAPFVLAFGGVTGGDDGVSETLPKPFRLGYLRQRVLGILLLRKRLFDAHVDWPAWSLEGQTRRLFHKTHLRDVYLTDKEAALLAYLARAGAPVARDVLLADVWDYEDGLETHTLETHIYRLRRKLIEAGFAKETDPIVVEAGKIGLDPSAGSV